MTGDFHRVLYRFHMRTYAEMLFRRSKREKLERIWLEQTLMRLGGELRQSEHWSGAAHAGKTLVDSSM
ncbi:hypothetical protein [Bradyrhizobium sp. STM 3562]|uniref:hypothetical protein n=1 Tax=Bradyrhizobium sp. STM 3562 TaxID=578924 RepID=UPI00388D7797